MGITWGIEKTTASDARLFPDYLGGWSAICAAGVCDHFAIPVGDTLHTYERQPDGTVRITQRLAPEVVTAMRKVVCHETTYAALAPLDGFEIFFPDQRGARVVDVAGFRYKRGHDLSLLEGAKGGILAQMGAAAAFCRDHRLIISIDF